MPPIRQLPAAVVNKIAAGEVIERPASVVKELLENAVDAGAMRIDVAVEQGGIELVRVVDNGCGVEPDQLPLTVAAHATSKISSADDLFRVGTLGFRGEALASIAEVSQLRFRSRTREAASGSEITVHGGRAEAVAPCGCPEGTAVEVRNLFFNTPVRKKFLRSAQTEMGHTSEALTRIALAYPAIHFTLRHGDRTVYDLPPVENWKDRIAALHGAELADALIEVESRDGPISLAGYAAHPSQTRSHLRMQYLLLNGRAIRDRSLQHALGEAYRGLILTGRYPMVFLRIEMPPDAVDVNVHPTKLEVRFQDSGRLYSQLLGTLRTKFLTVDLTTRLQTRPTFGAADPTEAADSRTADARRAQIVSWARGELAAQSAATKFGATIPTADRNEPPWERDARLAERKPLELVRIDRPAQATREEPPLDRATAPLTPADSSPPRQIAIDPAAPVAAMQFHNRYLIAESEEGVVVIDQHALHERVLYEQLRERVLSGSLESQRLLVPETVDLSPAEAAAALANQELLAQLGVEVSAFGGDTILVTSYPAMLANFRPAEVLREVVTSLVEGGKTPDRRDLVDELLHMIACKAAVKAGDRLSPEEVAALVRLRHLAQDSHHCPHGRPTVLVFTHQQLDRQFMRT